MATLSELRYDDRFVRDLPADPRTDNRTRQVMAACYSRVTPTPVGTPEILAVVPEVAALLELDPTPTRELADALAGNTVVGGMAPYAACYGGHQFGNWAGQLGDGRAITLGEVVGARGKTWEIQLKGAGPTPYSRRADGRAVLRSSLRELVCSEAMHHLGVPTTRALSLVLTGEQVERDMFYDGRPQLEPGAVVCRVAPTFLRFGSFEIHSSRDDKATLQRLVDFTLARFFPGKDVAGMFEEICAKTAWMVSEWMRVGFVHGVMNTDNMSILGLTIDYGPYGWIESFDPGWTPNTTDAQGKRYRFGAQPEIARWNLTQLARALAPVAGDLDPLRRALDRFSDDFSMHYRSTMLRKLGLHGDRATAAIDDELLADLASFLIETGADMTLFFRGLARATRSGDLVGAFYDPLTGVQTRVLDRWLARYLERAPANRASAMEEINPLYVPRNYLLHECIEATTAGDRAALPALLDVLRHPYTVQPGRERYASKRPTWALSKPGCSMLSCSS